MNRLFEIQTLSDCNDKRFPNLSGLSQGGVDPISIILGGLPIINQIFPNLFPNRRRLTQSDWLKFFPSSGKWTTELRQHLSNTINYDTDLENIPTFTRYFVKDNFKQWCPQCNDWQEGFASFSEILKEEARTGGSGGGGSYPYGSTINWQEILLYGGGAVLLLTLLNKKKK